VSLPRAGVGTSDILSEAREPAVVRATARAAYAIRAVSQRVMWTFDANASSDRLGGATRLAAAADGGSNEFSK
jgi:hypothetical protein